MRVVIWILVGVFFLCWLGSFAAWLYGGQDRRFLLLTFGFQIVAVTMASFLDRGTS